MKGDDDGTEAARAARAVLRRATWSSGVTHFGDQGRLERDFWKGATADQLLEAWWQMAQLVWQKEHPDGSALRLDRSLGGVRRRQG